MECRPQNNVGVGYYNTQQWKTLTNTGASWRSHARGTYNHPKLTSRVHLARCRRSSSSRHPVHLRPIRSGTTDNYLSYYDIKPTTYHQHTQCSKDPNNNHMADCPKALASLTNTYAGLVSTLGQCTTCTRWQEAGTNKYLHPVTNNNAGRSIFYHPLHCHGDHTVHTDHYAVVLQAPRMLPWLLPLGYSRPIG